MLEKSIVNKALKILRTYPNTRWEKTHGSAIKRGEPDVHGCVCGIMVMIEFKRPGEEVIPGSLQDLRLNQWMEAGAVTAVAYGAEGIGIIVAHARARTMHQLVNPIMQRFVVGEDSPKKRPRKK